MSVALLIGAMYPASAREPLLAVKHFVKMQGHGLTDFVVDKNVARLQGRPVINTNAIVERTEIALFDSVMTIPPRIANAKTTTYPAPRMENQVIVDPTSHLALIHFSPKSMGGSQYVLTSYSGVAPADVERRRFPHFTLSGIGIGSRVADLYSRYGVPAAGSASLAKLTGIAAYKHDFSGADGVYRYTGVVPNAAQSCVNFISFAVSARRVVAMRTRVEC